jgi:dihydrofolate synthase/folylpolyglutamate synthase
VAGVLLAEATARGARAERVDPAACLSNVVTAPEGVRFDAATPGGRRSGLALGLAGGYQAANALLAIRLAEIVGEAWPVGEAALRAGLAAARVPGRFDRRGRWLFDVAHNLDGVRALVTALEIAAPPRPLVAVVAVLRDKAWREMLRALGRSVDRLVVTSAPSAPPDRVWDLAEVAAWAAAEGLAVTAQPDFGRALDGAAREGATVLVTGSFHTVGDAMSRLPGAPPLG